MLLIQSDGFSLDISMPGSHRSPVLPQLDVRLQSRDQADSTPAAIIIKLLRFSFPRSQISVLHPARVQYEDTITGILPTAPAINVTGLS